MLSYTKFLIIKSHKPYWKLKHYQLYNVVDIRYPLSWLILPSYSAMHVKIIRKQNGNVRDEVLKSWYRFMVNFYFLNQAIACQECFTGTGTQHVSSTGLCNKNLQAVPVSPQNVKHKQSTEETEREWGRERELEREKRDTKKAGRKMGNIKMEVEACICIEHLG